MRLFEGELNSDEIEESFLKIDNRIRPFGLGSSEVILYFYTKVEKLYQSKSWNLETGDILRI